MTSSDNGLDQSYSIKLMKTRFSTNRDTMRPITMLPQLDIRFHFLCRFRLSEWSIIKHPDQNSAVLVKQSRRRPSIRNTVRLRLMQFSFYKQTREAIGQALVRLMLPDLAEDDNEKLGDVIEYAIVKAAETVKSKPTDCNVLDLYFIVLAQH